MMPWTRTSALPINGTTGNQYNGINVLQLWCSAAICEYDSSEWASYKQWQQAGKQVQKGEKSTVVVFYKELPREEDEEKLVVLRYSRVFNACQLEDYEPVSASRPPVERLAHADTAIAATGIPVKEKGQVACYVPESWRFFDTKTSTRQEAYYSTLFHELVHATGHKKRLDRELTNRFGDPKYAFEELVAELGAAFCCAELDITAEPRHDHAQYIQNWLQALRDDKKAIFKAAALAQKATDYLLAKDAQCAAA